MKRGTPAAGFGRKNSGDSRRTEESNLSEKNRKNLKTARNSFFIHRGECATLAAAKVTMSSFHTEGQGNVPEQAVPVLPNRLDLPAMQELERALGGASRVAWLVEDSLRPAAEVMDYLRTSRAAGILCAVDRQSREVGS